MPPHRVSTYKKPRERFGQNVRSLREARGWSQEAFAAQVGRHRTFIGALERGTNSPSLDTIVLIAKALGVTTSELLDGI